MAINNENKNNDKEKEEKKKYFIASLLLAPFMILNMVAYHMVFISGTDGYNLLNVFPQFFLILVFCVNVFDL